MVAAKALSDLRRFQNEAEAVATLDHPNFAPVLEVRERLPEQLSKFNAQVVRDLETIYLKCLEKAPRHLYSSAAAVGEDLSRWLAAEPILARPVGPITRLGKWCRRKPAPASLAAALVVAVTVGFGAVTWTSAARAVTS
jgi:hypothetical protein